MFSYEADIPETYWLLSDSHEESPIHFEVDLFFIELSSLCLPPCLLKLFLPSSIIYLDL